MTEHTDLEVRRDVAAMTPDELKQTYSVAKALALSKRFPDAKTADEAFAKILVGRDLGLSPTQALTGLHIVEGRPQIAAVTLAGFVRKSERYDYTVKEHDEQHCKIEFRERMADPDDSSLYKISTSEFTIEEAKTAGLVKDRGNWVKWPKNMLFARAMSNGVKWFCPDLMGGVPIYTEADVFEGTASELAAGEGTGEPVGWKDISAEQVEQLEDLLQRAAARGHAGFAHRPTVEMIVNGQTERFIADWISLADEQLDEMKVTPERAAEVADVILGAAETPAKACGDSSEFSEVRDLSCELAEGHEGPHLADGVRWERFTDDDPIPGQESLDVEEAER